MISAEITSDVEENLRELAGDLDNVSAKAALRAANYAGGKIAEEAYSRMNGKGTLARSFLPARFVERSDGIAAGALSTLVYAGIQDKGGTIHSKNRMLSIPLSKKAEKRWPRDFGEELFLVKTKAGKALLAERIGSGKRARLLFHYVLKKSVDISPKGYIEAALDASSEGIREILDDVISERTADA